MALLLVLVILAVVVNGLFAGVCVDIALVTLPARRRIGSVAYATFARAHDLGNGLMVYPPLAISAALLTLLATVIAFFQKDASATTLLLVFASSSSIGHWITTSQAAPLMLSLRHAPDDEMVLSSVLNRFARWHTVRTICVVLTFSLLIATLIFAERASG